MSPLTIAVLVIIALLLAIGIVAHFPTRRASSPGKLTPSEPWPRPPELSCFAKGIAKSVIEHPEEWVEVATYTWPPESYALRVDHQPTGLRLCVESYSIHNRRGDRVNVHPRPTSFSAYDRAYLFHVLQEHPIGQMKRRAEAERERVKREADTRAHFEKLGCP